MSFPDTLTTFQPDEIASLLAKNNHPAVGCLPFLRHSESPSIWLANGQKRLEIISPDRATITTFSTRGFTVVQGLTLSPDRAEIIEEVFNPALSASFTRHLVARPCDENFLIEETTDFTNGVKDHWRCEIGTLGFAGEPVQALASVQMAENDRFQFEITTPDVFSIKVNYFPPDDLRIQSVKLPAACRLIPANGLFPILTIGSAQFYHVQVVDRSFWLTENKIASGNYSPASVNLPAGAITATWCGDDFVPLPAAAAFYRQLLSDKSVDRLLGLPVELKAAFIGENQASFSSVRPEALHSEMEIGDCLAVKTIGSLATCARWLLVVDGSMPPLVDPLLNKLRQLLATQEQAAVILLSLAQKRRFQSTAVIESFVRTRPTSQDMGITRADGLQAVLGKTFANELLGVIQGLAACNRDAVETIFPQLWASFLQATGFDPSRDLQKLTAVIATDLFVPGDDVLNKWPSLFDWVNQFEPRPPTRIVLTNVGQQSYQDANCVDFLAAGGRIAPARQPMIERLMSDLVAGKKVSRLLGKTYSRYTKLVDDYWYST